MFIDLVTAHPERFVLRFWNYTPQEHERLLGVLDSLADGRESEIQLALSTSTYGIASLILKAGSRDRGARIDAQAGSVLWELDRGGWNSAHDLAVPVEAGSSTFQWLDEQAEVSVLLSPSGRW